MSESVPTTLRALVRRRAGGRCEYCLVHDENVFHPHEPDHIIASKLRGKNVRANLAWACFYCNRSKSSHLVAVDIETGRVVRLYNPRRDFWDR